MKPNVKRERLPEDGREKLVLYCEDSPARPGYEQAPGTTEQDYLASLPLDDGRRLELHMGAASCHHFTAMLAAMATDDADDEIGAMEATPVDRCSIWRYGVRCNLPAGHGGDEPCSFFREDRRN